MQLRIHTRGGAYAAALGLFLGGCIVTAALIYLTPLKWITVIEPSINDIEPTTFYTKFTLAPEKYLFVDVRPAQQYAAIHALGSINIPLVDLYDAHRTLPRHGKTIVLICSSGRSSGIAYSYLQHYGFFNIARIRGGLEAWVAAKLPVEGHSLLTPSALRDTSGQSPTRMIADTVELFACPHT